MPQKDDFLSRLQAQLRETLIKVETLVTAGRLDDALAEVWAAERNLGLEHTLLSRLPSADLLRLLGPTGTPDLERTLACAELLRAEFGIRTQRGDADPATAQKALDLYLAVFAAELGFALSYAVRLDVLTQALLVQGDVPPATERDLAKAYRAAGRFDEAENWLYRWRDAEPEAARGWAEAFYRDLLGLSDEALLRGGLPRAEVEEGLADVTAQVST